MNSMRTLSGRHRLRHRDLPWTRQVAVCSGVNHHVQVVTQRSHTKEFDIEARRALGLAVIRAREAMGLSQRAFAAEARIGRTSLYKLETGEPVGPPVYEAVSRALPGWTEDTPRAILSGEAAPEPAAGRAPVPRVSPVITADADDPEFWFALQDEVSPERFRELRQVYLEKKAAERKLAERSHPDAVRPAATPSDASGDHG